MDNEEQPEEEEGKGHRWRRVVKEHAIAFWAGIAAFAGNLVGLKIVDFFNGPEEWRFLSVFVISIIVGVVVYANQRVTDARIERLDKARLQHWALKNGEEKDEPPSLEG